MHATDLEVFRASLYPSQDVRCDVTQEDKQDTEAQLEKKESQHAELVDEKDLQQAELEAQLEKKDSGQSELEAKLEKKNSKQAELEAQLEKKDSGQASEQAELEVQLEKKDSGRAEREAKLEKSQLEIGIAGTTADWYFFGIGFYTPNSYFQE